MGISEFYGAADEEESIATINRALDLGVNFLDTSDMYAPYTNEKLIGKVISTRRDEVILATKFGIRRGEDPMQRCIHLGGPSTCAKPATARSSVWAWIT